MQALRATGNVVMNAARTTYHAVGRGVSWAVKVTAPVVNPILNPIVRVSKPYFSPLINTVFPVNPITHRRNIRVVPEFLVNGLGTWQFSATCKHDGLSRNKKWNDIIQEVGQQLRTQCDRPDLEWEFVVKHGGDVNAACFPGGKTFITTALMERLEPQWDRDDNTELWDRLFKENVGAVLGHEMGHACGSHGAARIQFGIFLNVVGTVGEMAVAQFVKSKSMPEEEEDQKLKPKSGYAHAPKFRKSQQEHQAEKNANLAALVFKLAWGVISLIVAARHSQSHETEADIVGMLYAKKAGLGTDGMERVQHILAEASGGHGGWFAQSWFASHPQSEERIETARKVKKILDQDGAAGLLMHDVKAQLRETVLV